MQIPCFIDKALSYAGLGRYERMVMSEVMEQVYGVAKRPVAVVNQTVIAKAFGIPRQRVQEAVKSLVKSRILIVQGEFFTFNDVFTEWARPDLTWPENVVASLDVSRSSVTKARYTVQSDTASVTPQRDNSTVDRDKSTLQRDTSTVTQESVTPDRAPLSRSSVTTCHAPALQPDVTPQTPLIGTRAELNSEKKREEDHDEEAKSPEEPKAEIPPSQGKSVLTSQGSSSPAPPPPAAPVKSTTEWVREIDAWLDNNRFDSHAFYKVMTGWVNKYSGEWVLHAVEKIMLGKPVDEPASYIAKTLENYRKAGGPEQPEAAFEASKKKTEPERPGTEILTPTAESRKKMQSYYDRCRQVGKAKRLGSVLAKSVGVAG